MKPNKQESSEFDVRAAIRAIEEKKEAQRLKRKTIAQEKRKLQEQKDEEDRLAAKEESLREFEDERYFRMILVNSVTALVQEVASLKQTIQSQYSAERWRSDEDPESIRILREIADCIEHSEYSGLAHIRAKYIPKDYL